MFYERIVISGCKRFSVSGRHYLEVKPSAKVQMILGTNGSGKSSLAQLGFSPLPINPKWMKPGGYFIKEGTYKGDRFYLEGRYIDGKKVHYTFKKNDEVLLEDGNVSTYVDLVKLHLNYDKWLHELLIGKVKFTELGPQQRQDFLSRISNMDFTQAFKMLAAYKKRYGHYVSVTQFLQSRINEESARLLDKEEFDQQLRLKEELQRDLKEVEEIELKPIRNDLERPEVLFERFGNESKAFLDSDPTNPYASSPEALKAVMKQSEAKYSELVGQRKYVSSEIDAITQKLGFIENNASGNDELLNELKRLEVEIKDYDRLPGNIPVEYYTPDSRDVVDLMMLTFRSFSSEPYDPERELELHKATLSAETFLKRCEMRFEQITQQLSSIEQIKAVQCPQCSHEFKPGVDISLVNELIEKRAKGEEFNAKAKKDFEDAKEGLDEMLARKAMFEELERIKLKYSESHKGLFTYIDSLGGFGKGKELISHLTTYSSFCQAYHRKSHLLSKIERLKVVTKERSEMEKDLKELTALLNEKNGVLIGFNDSIDKEEFILSQVERTNKEIDREEVRGEELTRLAERALDSLENMLEKIKHDVVAETVNDLMGRISIIHKKLDEQSGIRALIDDFEKQLVLAKKKTNIMKEVVDALSPKTGLIAEQLSISIGAWVDEINQLIDKVWGYSLEIRMGQVGENGLDYRFPMRDSEEEREDVSEGSDSMLEWINRAVVMVSYYSLDLMDMPLFLDEPGRTFDRVHQLNIIPLIRDLSDSVRFSQIVLISHNEEVQTAFPNSETVILDDRNIDYPHPYNLHVSFEEPE